MSSELFPTDNTNGNGQSHKERHIRHVDSLYSDYFNEYASYVILDRAVPYLNDGLKPVQRRILHTMREKDDGRYTKVANLVGATMALHPHGDSSIEGALVQLALKELLIDPQGNFGSIITGDSAAAARYIEARLTPFAREVLFSPKITDWQDSYDGRTKEPITLPVKFPLVLAQGVEGIAVGLACRILPHNIGELLDASIAFLRGEEFTLYPDFPTGGIADASGYNEGQRGGRIRVRAKIEADGKRKLRITELPFGVTTEALKASIELAVEKNKIKASSIDDFTAKDADLVITLPSGVDADTTIQALYAFTLCEVSLAVNACVIAEDRPQFLSVSEILKRSTLHTQGLLKAELEVRLGELEEKWHFSNLEKIYIEKEIWLRIRQETTYEGILGTIDTGFEPYKHLFRREITREDLVRLTEIPIIRISRYSTFKADEAIRVTDEEIAKVKHNLAYLTDFTISWFTHLKDKYAGAFPRRTQLEEIRRVRASEVIIANEVLYLNAKDGFVGYGAPMKKEGEEIGRCSQLDDIAVISKAGVLSVHRVSEKAFIGPSPLYVDLMPKGEDTRVFSLIYLTQEGISYAKKFQIGSYTLDRHYELLPEKAKILYFKAHSAEDKTELVEVRLDPNCGARKKELLFDLGNLAVKGRNAQGNRVTKYPARRVVKPSKGASQESLPLE